MGFYMYFPSIKGDATETGFKDWITLTSIKFGTARTISAFVGSGTARESSVPIISEVAVTKLMDASTAGLFRASVIGSSAVTVDIVATRTGAEGEAYLKLRLSDVVVASWNNSSQKEETPREYVSLSCAKILITVTTTDSANNPLPPMTAGYDLSQNAEL